MLITDSSNKGNINWLSISGGKIVLKTTPDNQNAVKRTDKNGKEVYEQFFAGVKGTITSIIQEVNPFGQEVFKVSLRSVDELSVLTFNTDSGYGRHFLAQVFNVDISQEVQFTPWSKKFDSGNTAVKLYLSQNNNKVLEKLPEGTPEVTFVEFKGKKTPDINSLKANSEFLTAKMAEFIEKNNLTLTKSSDNTLQKQDVPSNSKDENLDDLPF